MVNQRRGQHGRGGAALSAYRCQLYEAAVQDPQWQATQLLSWVAQPRTLQLAYGVARQQNAMPGVDGITCAAWEQRGRKVWQELQQELLAGVYQPFAVHQARAEGPAKPVLPPLRDRIVQAALRLVLDPLGEADFLPLSYGYRPGRWRPQAVEEIARSLAERRTKLWLLDLTPWLAFVSHERLQELLAQRVKDLPLLQLIQRCLQAYGPRGLPSTGFFFPLLINLYWQSLDRSLWALQQKRNDGGYPYLASVRCGSEVVICLDGHPRWHSWTHHVTRQVKQALAQLPGPAWVLPHWIELEQPGASCTWGGFHLQCGQRKGAYYAIRRPTAEARATLQRSLQPLLRSGRPAHQVIQQLNPLVQEFVDYYRAGHASRCFRALEDWLEQGVRRLLARREHRRGLGWQRWPKEYLYQHLGLYQDYAIRRQVVAPPPPEWEASPGVAVDSPAPLGLGSA